MKSHENSRSWKQILRFLARVYRYNNMFQCTVRCVHFFLITGCCWPPDSNITMHKYSFAQYSQILNKKPKNVGILGSKVIFAFNVAHLAILTSFFFLLCPYYSTSTLNGWASLFIPYVTWKIHSKHFWPKHWLWRF